MWNPWNRKAVAGGDAVVGDEPFPAMDRGMTLALLALNIAVFLIEPSVRNYYHQAWDWNYSLSLEGLRRGYVWQFFTFQFLHGNWVHLATNLVLLHSMGPVLETTLGRWRFVGLYLGSGVVGGLVHVAGAWLSPRFFGHPVVGASAGLCGLLAALGAIYSEERIRGYLFFVIPFQLKAKFLLLFAGVASVVGTVLPFGHIAHLAHLGGLVGGLLCVNLMEVRPLPAEPMKPEGT